MLIVAFLVMFIVPLVPFKFDNCITIYYSCSKMIFTFYGPEKMPGDSVGTV